MNVFFYRQNNLNKANANLSYMFTHSLVTNSSNGIFILLTMFEKLHELITSIKNILTKFDIKTERQLY